MFTTDMKISKESHGLPVGLQIVVTTEQFHKKNIKMIVMMTIVLWLPLV